MCNKYKKSVFQNSIQYINKMFSEAPFLGWCIVYVFFLSLEWSWIEPRLVQYRIVARIILLSIIPFLLWWYESKKNRKAYKLRISTFRESRIIPKHEIDHLRDLFPDSQIDLFNEVLLPSLSIFYATFCEIGQEEYYKEKVDVIRKNMRVLTRDTALFSEQSQHKYRAIALTAFSFYRILFNGAIEHFCNSSQHNKEINKTNPWILLKRVPQRLSLKLDAESWRLYEFWEAIYGDPRKLQLNNDLIDYLMRYKDISKKIVVSSEASPDHISNESITDNIVYAHDGKISVPPADSSVRDIQKVVLDERTNNSGINQKKHSTQKEVSLDGNTTSDEKLATKFINWLIKKINGDDKRYGLNEGGYIFISPLLYDASVFITESLLNKYYQITSTSPSSLKQALIEQQFLDNKQYLIENDGQKIFLMRLNKVPVQKTASKVVTIEEAGNEVSTQNGRINNEHETKSSD